MSAKHPPVQTKRTGRLHRLDAVVEQEVVRVQVVPIGERTKLLTDSVGQQLGRLDTVQEPARWAQERRERDAIRSASAPHVVIPLQAGVPMTDNGRVMYSDRLMRTWKVSCPGAHRRDAVLRKGVWRVGS